MIDPFFFTLLLRKGVDGRIRLFRPHFNMARLNNSLQRLAMPSFEGPAFIECLKRLIAEDKHWVPDGDGYSM
jgi:branched-chain amino acid aminotransferase